MSNRKDGQFGEFSFGSQTRCSGLHAMNCLSTDPSELFCCKKANLKTTTTGLRGSERLVIQAYSFGFWGRQPITNPGLYSFGGSRAREQGYV